MQTLRVCRKAPQAWSARPGVLQIDFAKTKIRANAGHCRSLPTDPKGEIMNISNVASLGLNISHELINDGRITDSGGKIHADMPKMAHFRWEVSCEEGSFIVNEAWLPENWNGIFLCLGNGGMAGGIPFGGGWTKFGYAVATTDMGTSRGRDSGIHNPAVWRDFGWRATHTVAEDTKKLISVVYGKAPELSYFYGGSTGGQQAMSLAQRFPNDFDGILCGAPASNRIRLHTYFLWTFLHSKDENRRPLFSKNESEHINRAVLSFYGENAYVSMPKCDDETVFSLMKHIRKECNFLSEKQLDALEKIYYGPIEPVTGEHIYQGVPMGAELGGCAIYDIGSQRSAPHDYLFSWALGDRFNVWSFDFHNDFKEVFDILSPDLDATDINLAPFFKRGGKLLVISGSADAIVPMFDTLEYCKKVQNTDGNLRFYIAPSIDHAIAGAHPGIVKTDDGISLFDALRRWRENGILPGELDIQTSNGKTVSIKPIV